MLIIPAIDLKDGKCVRLKQGRAEDCKVYSEDPVAMARFWEAQGAKLLHVVDLNGAFEGYPVHTEIISRIIEAIDIPVEVGGGLRSDKDISTILDLGAERIVLGTRAISDRGFMIRMVEAFGKQIVVGIDAKDGKVQVNGWTETTERTVIEFARELSDIGVKTIIYTDTSRDGMMKGANTEAVKQLCSSVMCDIVASGGVSSVRDIEDLRDLLCLNLIGVIVGKALYEGKSTLKQLSTVAGKRFTQRWRR